MGLAIFCQIFKCSFLISRHDLSPLWAFLRKLWKVDEASGASSCAPHSKSAQRMHIMTFASWLFKIFFVHVSLFFLSKKQSRPCPLALTCPCAVRMVLHVLLEKSFWFLSFLFFYLTMGMQQIFVHWVCSLLSYCSDFIISKYFFLEFLGFSMLLSCHLKIVTIWLLCWIQTFIFYFLLNCCS